MIDLLVDGLDDPEGVCWDPIAGVVWTSDEAGQVYRVQLDERRAEEVARAPGFDSGPRDADDARIFRLSVDGEVEVVSDAFADFPNGCAVMADGHYLWIVESRHPTVNRLDLRTGELEQVTRLDGTVPDGVAFTADGGVLVSCYRPDRIVHPDAAGVVEIVADDPQGTLLAAPTNIAFAGPELNRLVCANLGRWHLALAHSGLRGIPLHYPTNWAADA